jgi:DNA-binding Lrp family transcriptional regulator
MITLYAIKAIVERLREAYIIVRYTLKVKYRNLKVKVAIMQTIA